MVSFATFMDKQVPVLRREYPRNCIMRIDLSQQPPAYYMGLGKALLSTKSEEEIDEHIATVPRMVYTLHILTDGARPKQDLPVAREKGYAEDISEISDSLHRAVVPILTLHGGLWAISPSGYCSVIREHGVENIVEHLKKAVWDTTLGYSAVPIARPAGSPVLPAKCPFRKRPPRCRETPGLPQCPCRRSLRG